MSIPEWVVFHVPHNSTDIPDGVRNQFIITDDELDDEIIKMTDHLTYKIFVSEHDQDKCVRADVSRLVVDVERFEDDALEVMSSRGMGAIYNVTSNLKPLRLAISDVERTMLIEKYYTLHHQKLESIVEDILNKYNRCLVIDCHSFPSCALPYEIFDNEAIRPAICIGTDDYHTEKTLKSIFMDEFSKSGWDVNINTPFSGALVPKSRYQRDKRVSAIMIEINRKLYIDELTGLPNGNIEEFSKKIQNICMTAVEIYSNQ